MPETIVTAENPAEAVDWSKAETDAAGATPRQVRAMGRTFNKSRQEFQRVDALGARSNKLLTTALGGILAAARSAMAQPHILVALFRQEGLKLTRATLSSPCLPFVKLTCPTLDQKTQSHRARVLNFAFACGMSRREFESVIKAHGIVQIAKLETQRRAMREGRSAKSDNAEELFAEFRRSHAPIPLRRIELDNPDGLALIVAGTKNGRLVAFGIDGDRARLLAALRHLVKSAASNPADGDPPMDRRRKRGPRKMAGSARTGRRVKA